MSITERMENDGLSFGDAAAKESLVSGPGIEMAACDMAAGETFRINSLSGDAAAKESLVVGSTETKLGERFSFHLAAAELPDGTVGVLYRIQAVVHVNGGYVRAADYVALERRFAEHLEAWRANNAHHAARIAELEAQLREKPEIDRRLLTGKLTDVMVRVLHYQEHGEPDLNAMTAREACGFYSAVPQHMIDKYRNEPKFHAQVDRAVSLVLLEIPK